MSDQENIQPPREPVWRLAKPSRVMDDPGWSPVGILEAPPAMEPSEPPPSWLSPAAVTRRPSNALVVFIAAVLGAVLGTGATLVATDRGDAPSGTTLVAPPVRAGGGQGDAVADVAKAVLPGIVRIEVEGASAIGQERRGTGSGVLYRTDGYIVTNAHVVEGADTVRVLLASGEELEARVVGTAAPQVDIAVLKVNKTDLKPVVLGSTSQLVVGSLAVAVGSPFGLEGTVTAGVISALHRNIVLGSRVRFSDAIQTDAPINPGNSGGALADGNGLVVGINTAILSEGGGNVGVGFAIPIEIVRKVADQIIATGRAQLPFLGISGQNLPGGKGALIQEIVAGGPAARAGLRAGDIIVAIDGKKITSMDDLIATLLTKDVGQVVRIEYTRRGSEDTVSARLASRPEG